MTEPNHCSINNEPAPVSTGPEDRAPLNLSVGNAVTENQSSPSIASTRNWIVYLPPEVRLIIYRYVLQLPYELPYDSSLLWRDPTMQGLTGILYTSRLIQEESLDVFLRENTFYFLALFTRFTATPSARIRDTIQNITVDIRLSLSYRGPRELFIGIIHTFGDPGIIRGRFNVRFFLFLHGHSLPRTHLYFFLHGLGRFTNFRIIEIDLFYRRTPPLDAAMYRHSVENALQPALGLAARHADATEHDLIFFPQQFLNSRPSRENHDWIDCLDGIRLDWNGDGTNGDDTNAHQNIDEFEPPT